MNKTVFIFLLFIANSASAQKILGTVFNDKGDLLPYASITIKGTTMGASANNKAKFSINITKGSYTVVCQHIGFTRQEKTVNVTGEDQELTFILAEQKLAMKEVIVKNGGEDPAYEIIRQAIKKREFYNKQVSAFECDVYSKDIIKLRNLPKKIFGQKIKEEDNKEAGLDSSGKGILYMQEQLATVHMKQPDKVKLDINSSRVSGSSGFGFSFPTFIS